MSYVKKPDNAVLSHDGERTFENKSLLPKIFLAGSIEMGTAEDWQKEIVSKFKNWDVLFFNPRRDDWDSSWKQEIGNEQFNHQVSWELNRLDECDFILMYFSPETKSPISLLELGLYAKSGKMIICCPKGFWRKGNVDMVCTRLSIPLYEDLDDAIEALKTKINLKTT
jgi:hypothetical protein